MKITIDTEELIDICLRTDEGRKNYLYGMFMAMMSTSSELPYWLSEEEDKSYRLTDMRYGWKRGMELVAREKDKLSKKSKAGKASASKRWVMQPAEDGWIVDGKLLVKEEKFEA